MSPAPARLRRALVAGPVALLLGALVACAGAPGPSAEGGDTAGSSSAPASPDAPGDRSTLDVEGASRTAPPTRVRVPSLDVESSLDALGRLPDGTLEAPPEWQVAGWFADGVAPGDRGPAVIAGHVDSPTGPAVFADLDRLRPGDRVEVDHEDGTTTAFEVDRTAVLPRDDFPTEEVYGPVPDAQLRLITCDGTYSAERGYSDNLVVYATAVPA
ncbi:class F sortase [Nocardioides zeae]|uniref:Class F sortase n=1 Tax=Nocardioides imazamoxiresistens TaxID=3231893 RepID=A0ABU3Q0D1_9ACTN|nr:class F sortase [Nocardioides zeae]MDT9594967.1 class F sortase [Nocardioides zeae]